MCAHICEGVHTYVRVLEEPGESGKPLKLELQAAGDSLTPMPEPKMGAFRGAASHLFSPMVSALKCLSNCFFY